MRLFFASLFIFLLFIISPVIAQPPLPEILSPTHSEPDRWYSNNDPRFEWMLPKSVDGVNVLADRKPTTDPGEKSDGWFNHASYQNIKEGVWYFHIKFLTGDEWGSAAHFKFQIDTEKPIQLEINQLDSESYTKGRFSFNADDKTSGIDHFVIKIDNGEEKIWRDYGDGVFETAALSLGEHKISVKAVDAAGNFIEKSQDFILEKILPPRIISSRRLFWAGQNFFLRGVTYRNAQVDIWIQRQDQPAEIYNAQSDSRGLFSLEVPDGLPIGNYIIWVKNITENGAHSRSSEKINIVFQPHFIWTFIAEVLIVIALFIPFLALIASIMFVIWYLFHKLGHEIKIRRKRKN